MTVNAMGRATIAPANHSSARDLRTDSDRSPDEFAGMFAGAMNTTTRKPEPERRHEGTSELDRPEEHDEKSDVKETKRRGRTHSAHAKQATDDATDASQAQSNSSDEINQSTAALDPELQAKLARVTSRVHDETGADVKVAETYRSQARQDALFAQGRQAPGPVVTWTQNSKHTQGRAVDLVLDGGTSGFDAYKTLQRIAQEEGLRTLGAKDPGHLELPGAKTLTTDAGTAAANDVTSSIPVEPADASGPGQVSIARLAQVAQVAQVSVAKPAEVARVAAVATVANVANNAKVQTGRPAADSNASTAPQPKHAAAGTSVNVANADGAAQRFSGGSSGSDASGDERTGTREHRGYSALAAAVSLREGATSFGSALQDVGSAAGTSAAERAARLMAALEDAPARPLSQITMSVDAGNGTTDRIQVALRGSSLNASIDAADAHGAQVMNSRADELVRALAKDGITVDSLHVRGAAATSTLGASQQSNGSSNSSAHSRSDRSDPWQQHDRQRSNDDRRQQQRNRRGGQEQ